MGQNRELNRCFPWTLRGYISSLVYRHHYPIENETNTTGLFGIGASTGGATTETENGSHFIAEGILCGMVSSGHCSGRLQWPLVYTAQSAASPPRPLAGSLASKV
ncbi:MAG: hypothetical protein ACP5O7_13295, partial [Phycisphaerae bacterium]